jgi:hypothetical protein
MHSLRLRSCAIGVQKFGAHGEWTSAAQKFADYWGGAGTWRDMPLKRRTAFAEALKPNFFEWDAVMNEATSLEQWTILLPRATLLVYDPGTVLPTGWTYKKVPGVGHMAPLTRPDVIDPLIDTFLTA